MICLNNDKDNRTIPAATIFTLAIIMAAIIIAAPAAATTSTPQPVTAATDNQSVNVVITWEPAQIEPGEDTEFMLDFQDPSSGESISHVNYNFEIMDQNGDTVQSTTDLHTHSGSDEQTVTFDTEGSFNLVTTIIGTGIDPPFDTSQSGTAQTVITVGQQLAGATGGNNTAGTTAGGGATTGGNATTAAGGGNQTAMTSEVISHLEEVRTALENDDTETALLHLDLALNALGANATTTAGGGATNATAAAEDTTVEGGAEGAEEEEEG